MKSTSTLPKKIFFGAVMLVIPLGFLFLIEAMVAGMGFGNPLLYEEHSGYRYALQPNQSEERRAGAIVTVNDVGLRGTRAWAEPVDHRVLFIGDSVTYGGSYITDEAIFAIAACGRLEERLGGRVTCGNAGVNAYGTDNMAARLRYKPFDGEDVVVAVVLSGDTRRGLVTVRQLPYYTRPIPGPFPALTELGMFAVDQVRSRIRFGGAPGPDMAATGTDDAVVRDSLARLFDALRLSAAAGKKVLLVHTPDWPAVSGAYSALDTLVVGEMAASGLPFLEMRPLLAGKSYEELYYDGVHLNEAGHGLYADLIAGRVADLLAKAE